MSKQEQLDLWGGGEELRTAGKDSVEMNNADFVALMRKQAVGIATRKGKVSSDDLRLYAQEYKIRPEHPNAWGSIFRGKGWRVVGRIHSRFRTNHAREIREWGIVDHD